MALSLWMGASAPAAAEVPQLRCGTATRTFTSEPADPVIPDGATRDFPVTVGGMGPIADVDVYIDLDSTRPGDLEITLLPPVNTLGGSGIVLSRANGGTATEAFRSLTFDDQAGSSTFNTAITDVNFTAFTDDRLPPQTPLARLVGASANGTWTLRIRDLSANGTASRLLSWRMVVSTSSTPLGASGVSKAFSSGTVTVPAVGGVFSDITVPASPELERVLEVRLTTTLPHADTGQYDLTLAHLSSARSITLSTDNGNGVSNGFASVRWVDTGAPVTLDPLAPQAGMRELAPEEPLAGLIGIDPRGTWRLGINDDTAGTQGGVASWSLEIITSVCADVQPVVEGESTTTGPVNDTRETATALAPIGGRLARAFGELRSTTPGTADVDHWYVDVPAGSRLWALAEVAPRFPGFPSGTPPSTRLRLLDPAGNVLATDEGDGVTRQVGGAFGAGPPSPSISGQPLATAGRYVLALEALPGVASVSYQVFVVVTTAANVTTAAPSLANYDRPIATIRGSTADGTDVYSVSGLVAGSLVLLSVDGDPDRTGSQSRPTLSVQRGPGLPVLQATGATSAPHANALIAEPGATSLSVTVASGGTSGAYALTAAIIRGPNADLRLTSTMSTTVAQDGRLRVIYQVRTDGLAVPYVVDTGVDSPLQFGSLDTITPQFACVTPSVGGQGAITCTSAGNGAALPPDSILSSFVLSSVIPPGVAGPVSQAASVRIGESVTGTPRPLDYDLEDNTLSAQYPLAPASTQLRVHVQGDPGAALPGSRVAFVATVTNNGPSTARNAVLTCAIGAPAELLSSQVLSGGWTCQSPTASPSGSSAITCTVGSVPPGTSNAVAVEGRIRAGTTGVAVGRLDCAVSTLTPDPTTADNAALARVAALVSPSAADTDGDGLLNAYETRFGLDPDDPQGAQGAGGDPDGDGIVSLDEQAAGTHPRGTFRRFFAEGSTGDFFDTRLALLHPLATPDPAIVQVRYLRPEPLPPLADTFDLPAQQRRTIALDAVPGLESTAVSIVVESDQPVVADRTMSWDARGYGSHGETGVSAPATSWQLAEGSTKGGFNLFYLLQNPNNAEAVVTVRYLRPAPLPVIQRTYTVGANARVNIWVNLEGPEFAATDVSASIGATLPIIVERAMYLDVAGQRFGAGHAGMGIRGLSTVWNLAEGSTGSFFDLFVLLANPTSSDAQVKLEYLKPDGTVITRTRTLAANSRDTVWVDFEDPSLANTAVSTVVTVTNGVGIVVERAMWWPGSSSTWHEAHVSQGATTAGRLWAVAEGQVGGETRDEETYLLIANVSDTEGRAEVTLYFEDGTTAARTFTMLPRSRLNVHVRTEFPEAVGRRFGSVIRSAPASGTGPGPLIIVEQAMYWSLGSQVFAAGSNMLGTRVQ